jgi:hypothetical protein
MPSEASPKVVRSYRLVFRRRWRIFRVQNWRIPLPGGLELRAIGYWLACLAAIGLLARLPLIGSLCGALPASLRLVALPIVGSWALSSWEVDGRSPHRALAGLLLWRARPRELAALRRCSRAGALLAPPGPIAMAPDPRGSSYPRGRLAGPARVLLRYPVSVELEGVPHGAGPGRLQRMAAARCWRLRATGGPALHSGRTLQVPAGRVVIFE